MFSVRRALPALAAACLLFSLPSFSAETPSADTPPPVLSPAEELKTFQLPPGYRMELVLSEPVIKEPVLCVFDGNGRMYVAEMRSYMQDIDATGESAPVSRISRHESSRGDGVFDQHTVFADNLYLPRMVLPLDKGRVLVGFTDSTDLFLYHDAKDAGVSDSRTLFFKGEKVTSNLEHQASGLIWTLDNWIYQTVNNYRLRWQPAGAPLLERTASNGGQWGLTQDDDGKPWFSNAGGEKGLWHFQTHILYASVDLPEELDPGFNEVWPAVGLADFQGGLLRVRQPDQTLNHFTGCAGQEVFRGDRLPQDLRGDILVDEPVGRLIRRAKIAVKDGITHLTNPYQAQKSEFLRSTDPYFRPVNIITGPDGCLYIVDMYRGIIQEGNWTKEGSYLRGILQEHGMAANVGRGRIWRLVHDGFTPGPQPHMFEETTAQLVTHLEHPNGWWRDTAQKLLVLRQDKSAAPALAAMARSSANPLARMHALWTLEGLGALEPKLVRDTMKDPNPRLRAAALRVSESLYKAGDQSFKVDIAAVVKDPDPTVTLQAMETSKELKLPDWRQVITLTSLSSPSAGVREIGPQLLKTPTTFKPKQYSRSEVKLLNAGQQIYAQICFACHNYDALGMPMQGGAPGATIAPPLSRAPMVLGPPDGVLSILLHGLAGPVDGKTYDAQMIPLGANNDEWIASIASFIRNAFGNSEPCVTPAQVARLRAATKSRTQPWTVAEIKSSILPQPLTNKAQWKVIAGTRPELARLAVDGDLSTRYTTNVSQTPGQWFEVELPAPALLAGLTLDAGVSRQDFPRGYKVELSTDGQSWGKPVAQGQGKDSPTYIEWPPVTAKFVRITQTGSVKGLFWSIHELDLLQPSPLVQH